MARLSLWATLLLALWAGSARAQGTGPGEPALEARATDLGEPAGRGLEMGREERAAPGPAVEVLAAAHRGELGTLTARWTTTVRVTALGAEHGGLLRLAFAAPLDRAATFPSLPPGVTVEREGADEPVTALLIPARLLVRLHRLQFVTVLPADPLGRGQLRAPVVRAAAPQLVTLAGLEGLTFRPDPALGLVMRLGFSAPVGLRGKDRASLLGLLEQRAPAPSGATLWVSAEAVQGAGGLPGELLGTGQRRTRAGVWLAVGLALAVMLLAITLRGLAPAASVEDAERVIAQEFARARPT